MSNRRNGLMIGLSFTLLAAISVFVVFMFVKLSFESYSEHITVESKVEEKVIIKKEEARLIEKSRDDAVSEMISISDGRVSSHNASDIYDYAIENAKVFGFDYTMILGMIATESRFITKEESFLGAKYGRGLMQVSEVALKDYNDWNGTKYTAEDLYKANTNIMIGCWTLNQQKRYLSNMMKNRGISECVSDSDMAISFNVGCYDFIKNRHDLRNGLFNGEKYSYLTNVQNFRKGFFY